MRWARWTIAAAIGLGCMGWALDASADHDRGRDRDRGRPNKEKPTRKSVPEIPVGGTAGALTLLIGGTIIVLERRRRAK